MSFDPDDTGYRAHLTLSRGNIVSVDDSKLMQTVTFRGLTNELLTVERFQTYGHTSVPKPPDDAAGAKAAEVVIGFVAGDRSHPVLVATDDRRYRMKNLKSGEVATHDDQGQNVHVARDGINHTAKQHVMSATDGPKPLTTFELNDQLKGLGARADQLERNLHGLFDVTSRMRDLLQKSVAPNLAALAPILSQTPDGLDKMEQAIAGGPAAAYLQKQIGQALPKFGASPMAAVSSVLDGGIEELISAATEKIAGLMSANPAIAVLDGLVDELASLNASGSPPVVAEMVPIIQGLIDSVTAGNPVVAEVADLRSKLAGLMDSAGPGLNFLAPQQRMVQGLTKSLKLSQ